jgi:hypothetical protein
VTRRAATRGALAAMMRTPLPEEPCASRAVAVLDDRAAADWGTAGIYAGVAVVAVRRDQALAACEGVSVALLDPAAPDSASLASALRRRRPGLPLISCGDGEVVGWCPDDCLGSAASEMERVLALRQAVERSTWSAGGRGLSRERAELLARIRPGLLAALNENLTVVLSHADMLASRLSGEAARTALDRARQIGRETGRLVRQAQGFAARRQAVRSDLAALLPDRRALLAACCGAPSDLPVTVDPGPLWIDFPPVEADLLLLRLVLAAAHPGLALELHDEGDDLRLIAKGTVPPEREALWALVVEQAAARGGRARRILEGLVVVLPRDDHDSERHDDLLPHSLAPNEEDDGGGLESTRCRR